MSSYDLETRRLLCRERLEQLERDAREPMVTGRRRRRLLQRARGRLALSPSAYRARRASLGS